MDKVFNNNPLSLSLTSNLHLNVLRILAFFNVSFYGFCRYIACCSNKITGRPEFTSALISGKLRMLHQQPAGRNSFKKFCYIRGFPLWWRRKKDMDMFGHNLTAQFPPLLLFTNFIKNIFKRPLYFTRQNSLSILSNPYYVIGNSVTRILRLSFKIHILIIQFWDYYVKRYFRLLFPVLKYRVSEAREIL